MRQYRKYTDEDLIRCAIEVKSLAGLLRKLNLIPAGGSYANIKRLLQKLNVDCSHWTGQGWSKDKQKKDWADYTKVARLKPHLIKLRGHTCERCGIVQWFDQPINLEVHHLDGDRTNNKLTNLQLVCPNCHSYTNHYRGRKVAVEGLEPPREFPPTSS